MRQNDTRQLAALFRGAVEHQLQGRPEEALKSYDAVIRLNPKMAAVHCNRGMILQELGKVDEALRSYDEAIGIEPRNADAHFNRGTALARLNRPGEALRSYDQAIKFKPDHIAALVNRGTTLRELKRPEEALGSFDRVIALNPRLAMAHNFRANVLADLNRREDALQSFEQAIRLQPDFAEAWYNRGRTLLSLQRPRDAAQSFDRVIQLQPALAEAHHQRANALRDLRLWDEALRGYDRALELKSDFAEAYNERGNVLRDLKRADEALASYERAAELMPDFAEAHSNRGNALTELKRLEEALESHDRAVALKPDYALAHFNRGNTLRDLGRLNEALASYDRAIQLTPGLAAAHLGKALLLTDRRRADEAIDTFDRALENTPDDVLAALGKGMCLLQMGRFEEGWPLYEWRKKKPDRTDFRDYPQPAWTGTESLEGKTLFIYAEQGLGDTIQFCRYAQLARETGAKVIFAVQDPLVRLLKDLGPGIEIVGMSAQPPDFDYYIALLSMPLAFRTNLANCPANVPYLRAERERVENWRERLGGHGLKVGICWQGNPEADAAKSVSLRQFEAFAKIADVRLISLQKNDGVGQLLELPAGIGIETLGEDFDTPPDAFIDTAAVMETLDLVVTTDTAIAHLAGALGRPTWVALKHVPEWRWLLDRSDSPWYPTMRLFRQPVLNDWPAVFAAMKSQLPAKRQAPVDERSR
jgi:tetratricopeptide (TPR) repeat protein